MSVAKIAPKVLTVREFHGDKPVTYQRQSDGSLVDPEGEKNQDSWVDSLKARAWDALVPENLSHSVSKDYVPTRKWQLARDFSGSFAGTAALGAVMTAVGPANTALAALSLAGLTVANVTWVKDRLGQLSSMISTPLARVAEKNPRPWMLAADMANHLGTVLDASTAILPSTAYYPLLSGVAVMRAAAGAAAGAASANVAPRQALRCNLGEVTVKNANQGTLATMAGATAGIAALGAIAGVVGFGPAALIVSGVGAVGGLFANYRMLQNLDYNPVNEKALRKVLEGMDQNGQVPGPDKNLLGQLLSLGNSDRLVAGSPVKPLLQDPNFANLREIYAQRPYMMSLREGAPYLVMKDDLHQEDTLDHPEAEKMAQVQGMIQAIRAEKLLASPEYRQRLTRDGQSQADLWVIQESLAQTPADVTPLMEKMKEAGWSVDTIRFWGDERPVVLQEA